MAVMVVMEFQAVAVVVIQEQLELALQATAATV
jgi:hypothetical protein